jgi:hypothetical protein
MYNMYLAHTRYLVLAQGSKYTNFATSLNAIIPIKHKNMNENINYAS